MGTTKELDTMLGNPRKAVLSMAAPLLVSYLIIELNTFMDLSWCSGLGAECTSAVASISPLSWIAMGLGMGIGVGASAAIAAKLGTGEFEKSNSIAAQTLVVSLVLSIASTIILFFLVDPLIDMMGVTDIRSHCHDYVEPMILGSICVVFNGVVAGLLRAEGAARKSTYVLISAALTHMILDPILIYGLGMGLSGAAVATVIAMGFGSILGLSWYVRGKMAVHISFKGYRPKMDEIMLVLSVGIPRAIEIFIVAFMSMIQRIFVVQCGGTQASMYYNLPWNFITLAQSVSMALGSALIPISAAAFSMKMSQKARYAYHYAMCVALLVMCITAAVIFIFADLFVLPFTYSESMVQHRPEFVHVMRIYMFIAPCMGVIDVSSSMLQSMRKAQISMFSSLIRNSLIVVVLAWACTISLDAIYWSLAACELFGALLMAALAQHFLFKLAPEKVRISDYPFTRRLQHE